MLIDNTLMKKYLQRGNISANVEKTKVRVHELWASATREQQLNVLNTSGMSRASVYRVNKEGNISATLLIPLAQELNVCPQYIAGETDEQSPCSADRLADFLKQHGYEKLLQAQIRLNKKNNNSEIQEETPDENADEKTVPVAIEEANTIETSTPVPDGLQSMVETMTEDEAVLLLRSILYKSRAGGKDLELANNIKRMLLF